MDRYRESGNVLHLEMSRNLYTEAFKNAPTDYYSGINAASKSVLLGELDAAQQIADNVEKIVGTASTPLDYWRSATAAEVQLIKRKYAEAARLYKEAVANAPEETDSHKRTWLQAETLMNVLEPTPSERAQVASAFAHLKPGKTNA
jgi:predicted Zn-dependent protease